MVCFQSGLIFNLKMELKPLSNCREQFYYQELFQKYLKSKNKCNSSKFKIIYFLIKIYSNKLKYI